MGEALLMVELPAPMARLPAPKAMVLVGPLLFCRAPRLSWALVTVVAPVRVPLVIKLLVDELGWVPAKSKPLVLLAMMVLAILVPPTLKMPPPCEVAELPEMVQLEMVELPTKMPPPLTAAVLPVMVQLERVKLVP